MEYNVGDVVRRSYRDGSYDFAIILEQPDSEGLEVLCAIVSDGGIFVGRHRPTDLRRHLWDVLMKSDCVFLFNDPDLLDLIKITNDNMTVLTYIQSKVENEVPSR